MKPIDHYWYGRHPLMVLLLPLTGLFRAVVWLRRRAYRGGLLKVHKLSVPVIVVGNITVGGTGKTPLVAWLAGFLKEAGYVPGIVMRGYGGKARHWPQQVRPDSDPVVVGDEAVLLARHSQCPMAVGPDRAAAAQALIDHHACTVIIADDGLQHYALARDIEILVIDGVRRFGNGMCLPAGPLREPLARLKEVDLVVTNGLAGRQEYPMKMVGGVARRLNDPHSECPLTQFAGQTVHAVAGIANPLRFFTSLRNAGLRIVEHAFPDHHAFKPEDVSYADGAPVLMTEKDAVKCRRFARDNDWYVPVAAQPDPRFGERILALLKGKSHGQEAA